jgi:hypothetical protein
MMPVGPLSRTSLPTASPRLYGRGRREIRELLLESDQQLSEQPRELGLLSLGESAEHPPLGLEVTRSDSCHESPPPPCEGDEEPSPVVRVGDALDEPGLHQPVDQMRHPARRAHQGPIELGWRTSVRRADTPESSKGIPTRPVQPEAAEVLVQTAVEQGRGATDPCNHGDRRCVEPGLFLPPLREDTIDMVAA